MGIDRTNAGTDNPAEATEDSPPPDRRPPPDRPGAEGVPSRADSRNAAAAANGASPPANLEKPERKPEVPRLSSQETSSEQDSTTAAEGAPAPIATEASESPRTSGETSGERRDTGPTWEDKPRPPGPSEAFRQDEDADPKPERTEASPIANGVDSEKHADLWPVDEEPGDTAPTTSIEDQRHTTDQLQPSAEVPTKDIISSAATDAEIDDSTHPADLATDRRDITIEGEESPGSRSNALVGGQRAARGLDSPDDAESAGGDLPHTRAVAGEDKPPDSRLTIDGKQMRSEASDDSPTTDRTDPRIHGHTKGREVGELRQRTLGGELGAAADKKVDQEINQTLDKVNPKYDPTKSAYSENCTGVVQANELRRRGHDVEAGPLESHLRMDQGGPGGRTLDAIERPWGRKFTNGTKAEIEDAFRDPGTRGIVCIRWHSGGAHVFNVENVGGKVRFVDGQPTPPVTDASNYFNLGSNTKYLRLDDLQTADPRATKPYLEP